MNALGEGARPCPIGLDRSVVAQDGADVVEFAFFTRHGDQAPVPVSAWEVAFRDRACVFMRDSRGQDRAANHARQAYNCNCNHQQSRWFQV